MDFTTFTDDELNSYITNTQNMIDGVLNQESEVPLDVSGWDQKVAEWQEELNGALSERQQRQ